MNFNCKEAIKGTTKWCLQVIEGKMKSIFLLLLVILLVIQYVKVNGLANKVSYLDVSKNKTRLNKI